MSIGPNTIGYTTGGAVGSVRDYYREISGNKLDIQFTVTDWVQLPQTEAYYGASGSSNDTDVRQMALDAINAADTAGTDFSTCDSDADGWVDLVIIIHSGFSQSVSGNPTNCIWPVQWETVDRVSLDGVKMKRFCTTSAMSGLQASSTTIMRIGTACHEMGHLFGLADLYDVSGTQFKGVGVWSLMASGSWGVNWSTATEHKPTHPDAYSKMILGYGTPTPVSSRRNLSLGRCATTGEYHVVRDGIYVQGGTETREYFLIEHRGGGTGNFDSDLPEGIIIWHADGAMFDFKNNSLNWSTLTPIRHPALRLEEADGQDRLKTDGKAYSTQVFKADNGISGGFRDQTGDVETNAMSYQSANFYSRSNNSANYSYISAKNFSGVGATMTYDLQTLVPTVASRTVASGNFTVTWDASTNATQYEIQEAPATVLTSFSDGAEDLVASFENWNFHGSRRTSSGNGATGSYSYLLSVKDETNSSTWYQPEIQSITSRYSFRTTASTSLSFKVKSNLSTGYGYLKFQATKDNGVTWINLGTYSNQINWGLQTISAANLQAAGIATGDTIKVRFIVSIDELWGWTTFPAFGFAVDDISFTNIQMDGYSSWTSLASNVATNSYNITGKANGTYGYRVRAYANSAWQNWSTAGSMTVNNASNSTPYVSTLTPLSIAAGGPTKTFSASDLATTDPDGNTLTYTLTIAPTKGTLKRNGSTLAVNGTFTQADIEAGLLTYVPGTTAGGDAFTFTVADGQGGTAGPASLPITLTATAPTIQATNIVFTPTQTTLAITCTKGDGGQRIIALKEGTGTPTAPTNNTSYTASINWASKGTQLGTSGFYVIYNATGTNVAVSGLTANTTYTAVVYEYNGGSGAQKYLTTAATNNPASQRTTSLQPTVQTAAAATPSPATGTYTDLSVLGADDLGEAGLTYTWATTGTPPAAVTFSANGTNAAKATRATFTKSGAYTLRCTFADVDGQSNTSDVSVTVNQTATTVTVSPTSATVLAGATQTYTGTCTDQFGLSMSPTYTWSVSGGGSINSSGVFTAGSTSGGPYTVTATTGSAQGTAQASVTTPFDQWAASLPVDKRAATTDVNGTGMTNLGAYALGLTASRTAAQERAAFPVLSKYNDGSGDRMRLVFTIPNPAPSDVTYYVEACSDFASWTGTRSQRTGANTWDNASAFTVTESNGVSTTTITVTDAQTLATRGGKWFLRLHVITP